MPQTRFNWSQCVSQRKLDWIGSLFLKHSLYNDGDGDVNNQLNRYLRKVHISLSVVGSLPNEIRLQFVPVVGMRNGSAFGNRLGVLCGLPLSDPFVCIAVTGLKEESAENIRSRDSNWNGASPKSYWNGKFLMISLTLNFCAWSKLISTGH